MPKYISQPLEQNQPFGSLMMGSFWDSVIPTASAANETLVIDSLQLLWGLELDTSLIPFFCVLSEEFFYDVILPTPSKMSSL